MTRAKIFIVLLILLLTACGTTETAIPTPPPSTDTPVPTEAPISTAMPSDTLLLKFPAVNCCKGKTLDPGRYEIPSWLGIPLTLEVGEDWRVLNEESALLFLIGRGRNVQNNPSQMIVFINVTGKTTPEALIGSVQRAPELTPIAEPVNVTIAGFPGLQLDSTAKPNPSYEGDKQADIPPGVQFLPVFMKYFTPGFLWTTSSVEAQVRTIILTIKDQTLLLYLEAPQDEFDTLINGAEQILNSLELMDK